ncbi:MAG: aminotransferase class I/II-fold pyridoxal phosphate-dependent enzyme [Clostridia bacterium]|nr:aminotransferase class I/II-fold pyridoxal phosphate-dependent enzyme [Clostridia bacterium]
MAHIETDLLYTREYRSDAVNLSKPEAFPYFPATAFGSTAFAEIKEAYAQGYTYIRTNNPDRDVLAGLMTKLEAPGMDAGSIVTSSGMSAISTTCAALLKRGDHIVSNRCLYGETVELFDLMLGKFGVETTYVDFADLDAVRAAIRPETRLIYTEICANPTLALIDLPEIVKIARESGALLAIDNTFCGPLSIRPLEWGADIVINSLTKFLSGHSDILLGCVTANRELIEKIYEFSMFIGTPADPFPAFQMIRALETAPLRNERQMANAARLAAYFETDPRIVRVNHPSAESFTQRELAKKLWQDDARITGMMSVEFCTEDDAKIDAFMRKLKYVHYAPTLGGMRTSLSHPVTSSHNTTPDDVRRAMGITPALMRISVGIENADDLIEDFRQAFVALE